VDLHPDRDAIEGFHVDENEYNLGLVTNEGRRKPSFAVMQELLAGEDAALPQGCPERALTGLGERT
jgi:hypothetical protein